MKRLLAVLAMLALPSSAFAIDTNVMPEAAYVKGATSVIHLIFIKDDTTGLGKTGLTSGSSGLTIAYGRADQGNAAASTCTVAAATRGSYTSCGFVEKDSTNLAGWYEFGLTTAMLATGADYVTVSVYGVSGMVPTVLPIALVDFGLAAVYNRLGAPAGASMSADTAAVQTSATAIKAKTDSLTFTGANVGSIVNTYASGQAPVLPTVAGRTLDVAATGIVTAGSSWRRNVAGQAKFALFMRDSTSPSTPKTGLTLTVQVWKDTGSFSSATGTAEEIGNGWYAFSPSQADTNCALCIFSVTATGAVPTGYTINTAP
jgi:hypothetical protein